MKEMVKISIVSAVGRISTLWIRSIQKEIRIDATGVHTPEAFISPLILLTEFNL
jgi:hypothetical protein